MSPAELHSLYRASLIAAVMEFELCGHSIRFRSLMRRAARLISLARCAEALG